MFLGNWIRKKTFLLLIRDTCSNISVIPTAILLRIMFRHSLLFLILNQHDPSRVLLAYRVIHKSTTMTYPVWSMKIELWSHMFFIFPFRQHWKATAVKILMLLHHFHSNILWSYEKILSTWIKKKEYKYDAYDHIVGFVVYRPYHIYRGGIFLSR